MKLGFIIDNKKCIGCHACTVACKAEHEVPIGVNRTWVKYIEKGSFPDSRRLFSVLRCNHCDDAPCVEICPTSALYTRADGIVDFNNERCIGCKACMQACPYDALYIDPNTNTAAKCNYCSQRTEIGLEPACVNVCPTEAIVSGDIENPSSNIAKILAREPVSSRKEEKGTKPKLYYLEGDKSSLTPTQTDPQNAYMWSEQSGGVGHYAGSKINAVNKSSIGKNTIPAMHKVIEDGDEKVYVPQNKDPFNMLKKAREVIKENTRRSYDAPSKGVKWGWEITAYIMTKAISAGIFLLVFLADLLVVVNEADLLKANLVSLIFLGLTGFFLIIDLDQPKRFMYVLFRPHFKSWLVKGAYVISGFGAILSLIILLSFFSSKSLLLNSFIDVLYFINTPLAIMTTVYTAFLLGQAKGRDYWQNPLLVFHMANHSLIGGAGVLLLLSLTGLMDPTHLSLWISFLFIGILFHLGLVLIEKFMPHPTYDSKKAFEIIFKGKYKNYFRFGALWIGIFIPLFILLFFVNNSFFLGLAVILAWVGIIISTHLTVKAPQLIPLS